MVEKTNPRLLGLSGPLKGTAFPLPGGEVSIGRDSSNQLWVADPALSRRHCLVIAEGEKFSIRDLGSRNGTLVNGVPVEQQQIRHGDQLYIGDSVLVFLLKEGEGHFERNPVEFADTSAFEGSPVLLRPEDSVYLRPERSPASLPSSARWARDLNSLLKIATAIGGIRDQESLQWQLLGFIFDIVPAERGAVLLGDHPEEFSSTAAWDRVSGPGHPVRVSRTLVQRVLQDRIGLVASDVAGNESLRQVKTLIELKVSCVLCVPLMVADKVLGAIYVDSSSPTAEFDENHLQVMTAVAGIASLAFDNVRHWEQLRQENQELRAEIELEHNMVGGSPGMRKVFDFIRRVAPTQSTVLIQGESGTGKELVAHAIHRNSPRAEAPFVAINCAAIADTLLESELFGHEKGAFTGASSQKKGKVEIAEGGTLFLDEIGELAPGLQAKLLRVLQEREFERLGGTRPIKLDIRVIAATNRSLPEAVKAGTFRNDLYYRLNVVSLTMPALRERREDISLLANHFIAKASRKCKMRARPLSSEALACLTHYDWPGNVRELENALERALVLGSTDSILPDDLPEAILEAGAAVPAVADKYHGTIKEAKKHLVMQALQQANGSYIEAARALGMHPNSLLRLIRNLGLKAIKAGTPGAE
ncbi:MAG TPA: sigma 54-interacting transcriptional regulator [Terriglobales bacterium]|jgi:Nif-specific regulatory protein|nr:sigma 54-interacting transcriptional regulator [Terriglobales bacterium]